MTGYDLTIPTVACTIFFMGKSLNTGHIGNAEFHPQLEDHLFSRSFRIPGAPASVLAVVKRGLGGMDYMRERVERLHAATLSSGAAFYIAVEEPAEQPALAEWCRLREQGGECKILLGARPISDAVRGAGGGWPEAVDAAVVFLTGDWPLSLSPYRWQRPLFKWLEGYARHTFITSHIAALHPYVPPQEHFVQVESGPLRAKAFLTDDDVRLLYSHARQAAGGIIVEIGRYLGGSTNVIARAIADTGKPTGFFSYDPDLLDAALVILDANGLRQYVNLERLRSAEGFSGWQAQKRGDIDLLLVDGDHGYEAAMEDFSTWGTLVKPGGYLFAHDCCNMGTDCVGVDIAVRQALLDTGMYEQTAECCMTGVFRRKG